MPLAIGLRPPRVLLLLMLGAIVVLAWIVLWWLEQSPYGWLFHSHGGTTQHNQHVMAPGWLYGPAFLVGWLLMTAAMMLPTTVPLVNIFSGLVAGRIDTALLIALLLAGYLTAWFAFGLVALGLVWTANWALLNAGVPQHWIWGTALFLLAGAFQFSQLKYACLDKCRTPLGFVISHWHGRKRRTESFNIGWSHGLFCVGCCWALMMLMFAVGTVSLAWMLLLAVIMAVEKNAPWGRRLSRPLGVILLCFGVGIGLYNLAV